jgi:hypothetical protein
VHPTYAFLARVDWLAETVEAGGESRGAERTLTEGYAHALTLERRLRGLEREMALLAHEAEDPQAARRLRRLAPQVNATREGLTELRAGLDRLREVLGRLPAARG